MGRRMLGKQTEPSSISNIAAANCGFSSMSVTPSGAAKNFLLHRRAHACIHDMDLRLACEGIVCLYDDVI